MDYDNQYANLELEQALKTSSESIYDFDGSIRKIREYDVFDFLNRLAVLNCLPKNQNKEVVICGLIEEILSHSESYYQSSIVMSHSRFREIIKETEQSILMNYIDPPEGPNVQNIIWNGKIYTCFPGMDKDSVYRLQQIIEVLASQRIIAP